MIVWINTIITLFTLLMPRGELTQSLGGLSLLQLTFWHQCQLNTLYAFGNLHACALG